MSVPSTPSIPVNPAEIGHRPADLAPGTATTVYDLGGRAALHRIARLVDEMLVETSRPSVRPRPVGQRGQRPRRGHLRLLQGGAAA